MAVGRTPLPLCSCGVLPTAIGLARQGATRGATVAFLISTPEIGVDSIALSYALMDPLTTVFRPIAAFVTATVAGIVTNLWGAPPQAATDGDVTATGPREEPAPEQELHLPFARNGEPRLARPRTALRKIFPYRFRDLPDEPAHP